MGAAKADPARRWRPLSSRFTHHIRCVNPVSCTIGKVLAMSCLPYSLTGIPYGRRGIEPRLTTRISVVPQSHLEPLFLVAGSLGPFGGGAVAPRRLAALGGIFQHVLAAVLFGVVGFLLMLRSLSDMGRETGPGFPSGSGALRSPCWPRLNWVSDAASHVRFFLAPLLCGASRVPI